MTTLLVAVSTFALVMLAAAPALASTPRTGDFFEYDYSTSVSNGADAYYGYSDSLTAHYRYSVQSVVGGTVTVLGTGNWTYHDSTGLDQSGTDTYHPVFSIASRQYLSGIDVNLTGPASVWFWIPTNVSVGQVVEVLDEPLKVVSLSATIWVGAIPHSAILLTGSGSYTRNDVYGVYTATYQDQYYYDPVSGYVLSEQYSEHDVGTWQGSPASFDYHAQSQVTLRSYSPPLDIAMVGLVFLGIPATVVVLVVGIILVRRGPSKIRLGSGPSATYVRIKRVKSAADTTNLTPDGSPFFGPFLPVFAERSFAEGDPVVLALDDRTIVGLALMDRESGMGSLFANEDRVAKVLLKRVRMSDFFADATIPGRVLRAKEVDRFSILQMRNPQAVEYDSDIVRPMTAGDLPAVISLTETVYRGRAARFIESSFKAGDLGFVAASAGRIMGFGFATVVGTVARLHTLTVAPGDRARGLGTQIMNARLSTLAALGVDRVVVEISKQNAASLHIAMKSGFTAIGETVYYSKNPPSAPTAMQRQT